MTPFQRAMAGGHTADRLAGAFAAGYQAAMASLFGDGAGPGDAASLCATEEGGAHPRSITTRLDADGTLSGRKRWVTGGTAAKTLFVLATRGARADGKNDLVVARVDAAATGVTIVPLPPTPFVPEMPHAEVRFERAPVAAVLPGDGWDDWIKPFRTVEDIHVHAALLAYVEAVAARSGWPRETREEIFALLHALRSLADAPPSSPETQVALAGVLRLGHALLDRSAPLWERADADTRARWLRDAPLLAVAEKARAARREVAWGMIGPS